MLNPIDFTERMVRDFLRYQITTYPFADPTLHGREDRLPIFADNRHDAAFQAGWMRDHARRFRPRALMLAQLLMDRHAADQLRDNPDSTADNG